MGTSGTMNALRGHLMLLGAAVLWGCNAPMIKDLQSLGVPALAVADMRAVGAALAFWTASLFVGGGERVSASMLGRLCVAGILCIVLNQVLFTVGVTYTSPIDATVIATMLPIVTMIFSAVILKEAITGAKLTGILVGAAGAVTLVLGGGAAMAGGGLLGDALCFTAQVSCALYMVIFSNTIHRYSVVTLMKWLFLFAALIVTMVTWPAVVAVDYASLPVRAWGEILFVVFGGTFVSYIFFTGGQKLLRPTLVSMYNYVQPIVATVLSVAMGVGSFGWGKLVSMAMVFGGVYIVTHAKNSAAKG